MPNKQKAPTVQECDAALDAAQLAIAALRAARSALVLTHASETLLDSVTSTLELAETELDLSDE